MNEGWKNKKIRASDCVDYAFTYARREIKTLLPLLLIFHVPFTLISNLLVNGLIFQTLLIDTYDDAFAGFGILLMLMLGSSLNTIYYAVFIHVISGANIYSVYRYTVFGDRIRLGRRIAKGFRAVLQYLVFEVIISVAVSAIAIAFSSIYSFLSVSLLSSASLKNIEIATYIYLGIMALLAIAGIYIELRFSYMNQFALIENKGIFQAMGASWKATKGKMRRIISIYIVTIIVSAGLNTAVGALQAFSIFESNFLTVLFGAILAVFSGLGYFLGAIAITFSFMHDMPDNDIRRGEIALAAYLRENGQ